jgi:hypothetical protein
MKRLVSLSVGLAMALLAGRALAFGGVGGAAHFSGAGVGRVGPGNLQVGAGNIHGVNVAGAVTIRGIILLPDGSMIVPAVTPRNLNVAPPHLDNMQKPMTPIDACPYKRCAP